MTIEGGLSGVAIHLLVALLAGWMSAFAPVQQDPIERNLDILVRDTQGAPLRGIDMAVYLKGPPHVHLDTAATDAQGMVRFAVEPGKSYLISFRGDWLGYDFIDESDQNAGAMTSGSDGGFAVYLAPDSPSYLFTFVVGVNSENQLVPLYDLSRDPASPPLPYTYDGPVGDEVSLDLEAVDMSADLQPAAGIQQEAAGESSGGGQPDTAPEEAQAPGEEGRRSAGSTIVLVIGVIIAGLAVATLWAIIIVQARSQRG